MIETWKEGDDMEMGNYSAEQPIREPGAQADTDVVYQRSLLHFQDGKWQDAIAGFEEVLRLAPDHAEARAFLEEALMKASLDQDKPKPKRFRFQGRLKRLATIVTVVGLVIAAIAGGWWAYGRWVRPAQAARQEDAHRAQLLEQAYTGLVERDYAAAEKAFRALLDEDPNNQEALDGLAEVAKQIALDESYAQAQEAISAQEWDEALRVLEAIAATDPNYRDVQAKQALVQGQQQLGQQFDQAQQAYQAGDWQGAITAYEAVRSADSTYRKEDVTEHLFESCLNQGMHLVQSTGGESGAVQEAQKLYQKALAFKPLDAQVQQEMALAQKYLEGQSLLAAGDTEGAATILAWVCGTQPDYAGGNAAVLLASARGTEEPTAEPPKPLPTETAKPIFPTVPPSEGSFQEQYEGLIAQGDAAMAAGDYGQAEEYYVQAASVAIHGGTDSASWLFDAYAKAAAASARSGDYQKAAEQARTAIDIMSMSAVAIPSESYAGYIEQGDEYAENGDYQNALATYEMALRALAQKHKSTGSCGDWSLLPCEQ